jgi:hypothetical protein
MRQSSGGFDGMLGIYRLNNGLRVVTLTNFEWHESCIAGAAAN